MSIDVFGLNREVLVQGRRDAYHVASVLIVDYEAAVAEANAQRAAETLRVLHRHPFSGVILQIEQILQSAPNLLDAGVAQAANAHPEVFAV